MAERRMFSKIIIDSDAFLDMPSTTQVLYFHLSMRADDEGFINSPKKIQRMIGCNDDDMKLLILKSFVIPFKSGVIVIKHWKMHNCIRKDRMSETVHQEEKSKLYVKTNGAYTLDSKQAANQVTTICQPSDNQLDAECQHRLDKHRLDKHRLDKDRLDKDRLECEKIVESFNAITADLPKVKSITEKRKSLIKARIKEHGLDSIIEAFKLVQESDFLSCRSGGDWSANFDWVMKKENFTKIIEGNYKNKATKENSIKIKNPFLGQTMEDMKNEQKRSNNDIGNSQGRLPGIVSWDYGC